MHTDRDDRPLFCFFFLLQLLLLKAWGGGGKKPLPLLSSSMHTCMQPCSHGIMHLEETRRNFGLKMWLAKWGEEEQKNAFYILKGLLFMKKRFFCHFWPIFPLQNQFRLQIIYFCCPPNGFFFYILTYFGATFFIKFNVFKLKITIFVCFLTFTTFRREEEIFTSSSSSFFFSIYRSVALLGRFFICIYLYIVPCYIWEKRRRPTIYI